MRLAAVGLGDIARKAYLPVICARRGVTPVLCTRNASVLRDLAQQYRVAECYTDYGELLAARPDGIMLHTSTDSHFALARAALERDIPVFVDKPLSYHLEQTKALVAMADAGNTPLFCGFNRRYAPLYQAPLASAPIQVFYQKMRHNLPADPRLFIYDDFIHVLDFVRHCSRSEPGQLFVGSRVRQSQLASVQVSWSSEGASFNASMNRVAGKTRESLDYHSLNESWTVNNLREGVHYKNDAAQPVGFSDWGDTLVKRGFQAMFDDFLAQVSRQRANTEHLQGVLASHQLCERVLEQIGNERQNTEGTHL